MPLTVELKV